VQAILSVLLLLMATGARAGAADPQMLVALRTIGHELLLRSADSTSRVLPVQHHSTGYTVQFGADLQVDTDSLVQIVHRAMARTRHTNGYLVEVRQCATMQVVYSYEIDQHHAPDAVACRTRPLPTDCYTVTVMPGPMLALTTLPATAPGSTPVPDEEQPHSLMLGLSALVLVGATALFFGVRMAAMKKAVPSAIIAIGQYRFDAHQMLLMHGDQREELTGKEADLLLLLHSAVNTTLERDVILRHVWGDEGDYVGRTLDVFISRLRKKLEADPTVRIINVRGIGYRLVSGGV
jgi:hypothetical protein